MAHLTGASVPLLAAGAFKSRIGAAADPVKPLSPAAAAAKGYGMRVHVEPNTEGLNVALAPSVHYAVAVQLSNDGRVFSSDVVTQRQNTYTYIEHKPRVRIPVDAQRYAKQLFAQYCRHEDPYNDVLMTATKWG
eukprot:gene13708-11999_t